MFHNLQTLAASVRTEAEARAALRRVYIAWVYECTRTYEGWCSYEVLAASHADAVAIAAERFAGTAGAYTLNVDRNPLP